MRFGAIRQMREAGCPSSGPALAGVRLVDSAEPVKRSSPLRAAAVVLGCLLASAASACTPDDPPEATSVPPGSSAPAPGSDAYVYADPAGITAELRLDTSGATLTIENATGRALARPGVYVLDARDGRRVAWTVVAAAPIPDGAAAEFAVERPASPEDKHIGLAALLFGGEDHGAFVPPHPAQEAA